MYGSNSFARSYTCIDRHGRVITSWITFLQENNLMMTASDAIELFKRCDSQRVASASAPTKKFDKKQCYDCVKKNRSFWKSLMTVHVACALPCGTPENLDRAIKNKLAIFGVQALSFDAESCSSENYESATCPNSSLNVCEGGCEEEIICGSNEILNESGVCESCPIGKVANIETNSCDCQSGFTLNQSTGSCELDIACSNPEFTRQPDGNCGCPSYALNCIYTYDQFITGKVKCGSDINPYWRWDTYGDKGGLCSSEVPTISIDDYLSYNECSECVGGTREINNLPRENASISITGYSCEPDLVTNSLRKNIKLNLDFSWTGIQHTSATNGPSHEFPYSLIGSRYDVYVQCVDMRSTEYHPNLFDGYDIFDDNGIFYGTSKSNYTSMPPMEKPTNCIAQGPFIPDPNRGGIKEAYGTPISGNSTCSFSWSTCYKYRLALYRRNHGAYNEQGNPIETDAKYYYTFSEPFSIDYKTCSEQAYPNSP